jgi:hypothetical protein
LSVPRRKVPATTEAEVIIKKNITYGICDKKGHADNSCWLKPGNEHEKPQWLKNKEQASAAVSGPAAPELLLCGLTFPNSQKMLEDATAHSTPQTRGLCGARKSTAKDSVTMGNGSSGSIGKLAGTLCNKHGVELMKSTMQSVAHLPTGKFNLFSLTKMQKDVWLLHGNDKAIWLTKGNNTITFDCVIPAPEGMVFALCLNQHAEMVSMIVNGVRMTGNHECHAGPCKVWTLQ